MIGIVIDVSLTTFHFENVVTGAQSPNMCLMASGFSGMELLGCADSATLKIGGRTITALNADGQKVMQFVDHHDLIFLAFQELHGSVNTGKNGRKLEMKGLS